MLQYPLRPSLVGRDDHLLDSHLEGVRVKPKQCKLEVDLGLDPQSDTYDFTIARDHPFDLALAHGVGPPSMGVRRSGFVRAEGGRPSVFTTAATSASSDTGTCSKTLQCVSFRHSWGTLTRQAEKAAPSLSLCRSDGGQLRRATVCAHTYPTNRYDRNAEPHVRTKKQTLRSVPVPTRATYAVGLMRDGALHLVPVNSAVQLRPSLAHLDAEDEKKKADSDKVRHSAVSWLVVCVVMGYGKLSAHTNASRSLHVVYGVPGKGYSRSIID